MITIIIPMFNEQDRISATLRDIEQFIESHPNLIKEVLLVDDGSTDTTIERALYFKTRVPLKVHACVNNVGKWSAVNIGIMQSKGLLLLMDADGAASVWNLVGEGGVELIKRGQAMFGSRFMKTSKVSGKSLLRKVVSEGYRSYVRWWYMFAKGKNDINDMQCPWKLFYKEDLQIPLLSERFAGDIEFACRLNA